MRNITLSVKDETLREVKKIAAEQETTVNALVREYLEQLASNLTRRARLRRDLQRFSTKSRAVVGTKILSRDESHER